MTTKRTYITKKRLAVIDLYRRGCYDTDELARRTKTTKRTVERYLTDYFERPELGAEVACGVIIPPWF